MGGDGGGGGGDQLEAEGGIDGGGLAGFEVAEAFDVGIETGADLIDGGFHAGLLGGEGGGGSAKRTGDSIRGRDDFPSCGSRV